MDWIVPSGERSSCEAFSRNQVLASSRRFRFSYTAALAIERVTRSPRIEKKEIISGPRGRRRSP